MGISELNAWGNQAPIQGGAEIPLVASCYRNRDTLWPDGPLGLYPNFTFTLQLHGKTL